MEVRRASVHVLCLETSDIPNGIQPLFATITDRIDRPLERSWYGASNGPAGKYRACVTILEGDDPEALEMQTWEIPGGLYVQEQARECSSDPTKVAKAFQKLVEENADRIGGSGWGIEEYVTNDDVNVFLPIKE